MLPINITNFKSLLIVVLSVVLSWVLLGYFSATVCVESFPGLYV